MDAGPKVKGHKRVRSVDFQRPTFPAAPLPSQDNENIARSVQNLKTYSDVTIEVKGETRRPPLPPGSQGNVGDKTSIPQTSSKSSSKEKKGGGSRDLESTEEEFIITYQEEAVYVPDSGGGNSYDGGDLPARLLIVSSKIRHSSVMRTAILPFVVFVQYKFDSTTLEGLTELIQSTLKTRHVQTIALVLSCKGPDIQLTGKDEKIISKETIADNQPIREFFTLLAQCLDPEEEERRLDLLACPAVQSSDISQVIKKIEDWTMVKVGVSKDILGAETTIQKAQEESSRFLHAGELYFRMDKLRGWSGQQQTLKGFEKIQTVGKGAYGAAVLYKKKDDDSLVILKEINMHDLRAGERQLALNEVSILAMLDHPNIISYFDHFEEDGVLMIEIEYADGGTLAQFLSQQEKELDEHTILSMFQQIVAAIRHIHEHNILHRDLKTANIFLTKEGIIKVGDFGISKMMSSANKGANTVLGTPYYISPEMCEGKPYNDKSDIWALGCILYEMACLQKTFEGSNLPALVNKIMKGQFAPVKGNYSNEFKTMVMDMLNQDPEQRPSANELMYTRLPELMRKDNSDEEETTSLQSNSYTDGRSRKKIRSEDLRSLLFYFEVVGISRLTPIELPSKIKIRHTAVGNDHVIVVTMEKQVFTWGEGGKGQLGHGNNESIERPRLVESLRGKSISRASCGHGYSVFSSDNGIILTCGDGCHGCLGHGDYTSSSRPSLIESLLSVDIISVACGPKHVAVVGGDNRIFTWGQGAGGKLGLGSEEDHCQPMEVSFSEPVVIREVRCGTDGTMFLSDVGSVFACGSNQDNKLGLNQRQGFIMAMKNLFVKTEVEGQNVPTLVKALSRHKVLDIHMGTYHTAVIVEPGHVFSFGRNVEGQLGTGNTKESSAPVEVKEMGKFCINRVQCGDHYTVASTDENELYYWGLRFKYSSHHDDQGSHSSMNSTHQNKDDLRLESITPRRSCQGHSRQASTSSIASIASVKGDIPLDEKQDNKPTDKPDTTQEGTSNGNFANRQLSIDSTNSLTDSGVPSSNTNTPTEFGMTRSGGFRPLSSLPRRTPSASSHGKDKDQDAGKEDAKIIFPPMHLIKIDKRGEEDLTISSFFCHGENLFVQMETTAPPPKRKSLKKRGIRRRYGTNTLQVPKDPQPLYSASSREGGDEYSSEASELDTQGTVPKWLEEEFANSEKYFVDGNEAADDTSDDGESDLSSRRRIENSMSSIQINKDLGPVDMSEIEKQINSPRTMMSKIESKQDQDLNYGTGRRGRQMSISTNSTESELEFTSGGFHSDNSSREPGKSHRRTPSDTNTTIKQYLQPADRKSSATPRNYGNKQIKSTQSAGAKTKPKSNTQSHEAALKEQIAARGFVSDVTVKKKQEALLNELHYTREEKKKAEERIKELEIEKQIAEDHCRIEAEKKYMEKEKTLETEIDLLRQQLQTQNNILKDNQKMVLLLKEELQSMKGNSASKYKSPSSPPTPTSSRDSKVCCIQ